MGCSFTGGADSPEPFWELLIAGQGAVRAIPPGRCDVRRFYDPAPGRLGMTQVREAGFLQHPFTRFDPQPFEIPSREAESLDPQPRLLLEVTQWMRMFPPFDRGLIGKGKDLGTVKAEEMASFVPEESGWLRKTG
jgi:hypothetical protein